jgi:DNA end-binding protein Ku
MPRAIWTGTVSFGLVNVPVRMYTAIDEHTLRFHQVHTTDRGPIGYQRVCKSEQKPVPDEEITKAFEWQRGEYVLVEDADFNKAVDNASRSIEIQEFVDYEQIDPIYFERTYYLGPEEGSDRVYTLLATAVAQSGRAGIAKWVMRDKQHLGCLRVRNGVITLERMYFSDEIRSQDDIAPAPSVDERELEMARSLIDQISSSFEPEKYTDTHREALLELIRKKRVGETIEVPEPSKPTEAPDLMQALQKSLDKSKPISANGDHRRDDLQKMTKGELYEHAKAAGLQGRTQMTKDQLVTALSSD